MAYGLISIARLAGGGSRSTSEPAAETLNIPLAPLSPPAEIGSRVRYTHSFFRRMLRRSWTPQICGGSDR